MKIALLGSKDFDSLEFHINDTLIHMGHDVFHMDIKDVVSIPYRFNYWGMKLLPKYDEKVFKKIALNIIEQKPELVICTYRFVNPVTIEMIKKELKTVPVIQVNPDAITTFENQQIFASPYDAYFTKDPFMVDFMKNKMKLNAFYLPEALNPRVHKAPEKDRNLLEQEINIDVVAFGTMYPYRAKMVSEIIKRSIKVNLFGTPDRRFPKKEITENFRNEFITGERKADVLYGSKVIFNNFHYAEIQSVNAKYFEIAGIGGFQICDYKPTLDEYTAIDAKAYTYNNIDEAADLIKYYLDKPELRHEMALKQMQHFHKNHTYEIRIKEIFEKL